MLVTTLITPNTDTTNPIWVKKVTNITSLGKRDFTVKSKSASRKRKGKQEYLNDNETRRIMKEFEKYSSRSART